MNSVVLAILAKAPLPGYAKTRLIPVLGETGAAQMARRLLIRTVEAARPAPVAERQLWVAPDYSAPVWKSCGIPDDFCIRLQPPGDLGARLSQIAEQALASFDGVLLSGTDCVEVSHQLFAEAAQRLAQCDAIIYPAADGGYALLGLRRFDPAVFRDIAWSTPEVYPQTLKKLQALGWRVDVGAVLHDVDEPEDLALLSDR